MREEASPQAGRGNQGEILRSFFDRSGICMAKLDSRIRLIEANADFSRQFRHPPTELRGIRFCDLLHKDAQSRISDKFARMIAQQHHRFTEPMIPFRRKDSAIFNGELTAFTVRGGSGSIDNLIALVRPSDGSRHGRPPAHRRLLLTDLDVRILEGVASGVSTVQLASMLYLSRGGIEYHIDTLFRKLKVNNRPALIAKAYFMGVLCPGWPPCVHPDYLKNQKSLSKRSGTGIEMTDDAERQAAAEIEQSHPHWVVLWGYYSRLFWAFPYFQVPQGTIVSAPDTDKLLAGMHRIELKVSAGRPARFQLTEPSLAGRPLLTQVART